MQWKYESGRIYSVGANNELLAEVTFFLKDNGTVNIDHTYVNSALRGQGVAGKMMEVAMAYLKEKGLKVSASCSYAKQWLKKHRGDFSDIISDDIE